MAGPITLPPKFGTESYDPTTEPVGEQLAEALRIPESPEPSEGAHPDDQTAEEPLQPEQTPPTISQEFFAELQQEYLSTGELSEASYAALEARGVPRDVVDDYIDGQKVRAERLREEIFAPVGGVEGYAKLASWAAMNLSPAEIDGFNSTLQSGDPSRVRLALAGLHEKYIVACGKAPKLVEGEATTGTGSGYSTREEALADFRDPRYKTSEHFRRQVAEKLSRSRPNLMG